MDMNSALYQLMDTRTNGILHKILDADADYQEIDGRLDKYASEVQTLDLSKEQRLLIDRYISEQNALGARYGALAYLLGFSDCVELLTKPFHLETIQAASNNKKN